MNDDPPYLTADEFLEALKPTSRRWTEGRWLFRGHANAEWELKATGVRDLQAFEKFGAARPPWSAARGGPAWSWRRDQQEWLLLDFERRLSEAGIIIPTRSPRRDPNERSSSDLPDPALFPLMALAQHHGLPTLLLDWTRRPRISAYFAASKVVMAQGDPDLGTHLSVVAMEMGLASKSVVTLGPRPGDGVHESSEVREYHAPGGTNPNMRAQAGAFTIQSNPREMSIEEHMHRCITAETRTDSPLHRLVLPHREAKALMRLLAQEGIDGASMFPGADGVARAMRERAAWDREGTGAAQLDEGF